MSSVHFKRHDLMQRISDSNSDLKKVGLVFHNALVRTSLPGWKNLSWGANRGYDHNFFLIYITHDFSYGMSDQFHLVGYLQKGSSQRSHHRNFLASYIGSLKHCLLKPG